ncbi:MAG: AIR synthase-related protein [Bryobacteraceae bacterium]|nr:AIR synthase-related protein [Bryobacteraceae bacterium]MDW8378640.1 AIR synthase-related protein [Bryobacterales bacterium]
MVFRILVVKKPEYSARHMQRWAATLGLADLEISRAYFFETDSELPAPKRAELSAALADPIIEEASERFHTPAAYECWIAYQRGIIDNECDSIVRMCTLLGIEGVKAAKVATVYRSGDPGLRSAIETHCFNPNIEEIHDAEPLYDSLQPLGQYIPMRCYDLRALSDAQLESLGQEGGRNLNLRMMRQIREIQQATSAPYVTDVLLEAMDARWSDHCYHTTWKALGHLLQKLAQASRDTANPNIVSMFEDNAGVWDFYDGLAVALKAETHNGPSAISAYFGQLTKLGGVLRDILGAGQGADPVGVFEYTATGVPGTPSPLRGRPSPKQIAQETIRAIREYGNTFGAPMMWSQMTFHPAYRAKPFALGGCIGVIPKNLAQKGAPQKDDLLLLLGGLTGNDGIHGASASSAGAQMDSAAVQIGSPLEEVKFRAAIMELRDAGCIRAITDVGGAGLNSAVGEMGDPCGVWLNTALVPLKTGGLPMWRILLSESQERMTLAIVPEKLALARAILSRHEVRHKVIGKFTGQGRYTVIHDPSFDEEKIVNTDASQLPRSGEVGIDVPFSLLKYEPEAILPPEAPRLPTRATCWPHWTPSQLQAIVPELLADAEIASQIYASMQYDSTVQGRLTYGPYFGDPYRARVPTSFWAAQLIPDKPYASLFAVSFNPWLFEANPRLAARQGFLACLNKLVLAGSKLRDICLCDNFYTPHLTHDWAYWLVAMVEEVAALVRTFGAPVISGKDSSAGSVETPEGIISVPPAVFFSALGKANDFNKLLTNPWRKAGNLLVLIGPGCASAAGTVAQRVLRLPGNDVDEIDVDSYREYLLALERLDRQGVASGMPVEAAGILGVAVRQALATGLGARLELEPRELLMEHRCGAILEVSPPALSALPKALQPRVIGEVEAGPASVRCGDVELLTPEAIRAWRDSFRRMLE